MKSVLVGISVLAMVAVSVPSTMVRDTWVSDVQGHVITVEVDGDYYEFYGDGFTVGQDVTVVFDHGEIVDAF